MNIEPQVMVKLALLLSIVGIAIALAIAWLQARKARRAEKALKEALQATLAIPSETEMKFVQYVDVNHDGQQEILVQYPVGAHGSALKVFGWRDSEFAELSRISVDTPGGFEIADFDGDGRIEIRTQETDWDKGVPYVVAPRILVTMRWDGTRFSEISRTPIPNL
jgi:hypothetical protein